MYQLDELVVGGSALYRQIEKILRARIAGGTYPPGAPFPTDAKLCEEFKVSRATVRIALDAFQREGLIVRHPRRGSFVSDRGNAATTLRFNGSIEQIVTQGDGAGTAHHIEHCSIVQPSALEAAELQLQGEEQAMRLDGYRTRDGNRIGHVQISMPDTLGKRLSIRQGGDYACIFRMFEEQLGLKVQRVRQIVSVAMPSRERARALGISPKVPLLVRQRTFLGPNDMPLELAIASYPSDRYRYEIVIS
jgi:GntR family transcriptional regulator